MESAFDVMMKEAGKQEIPQVFKVFCGNLSRIRKKCPDEWATVKEYLTSVSEVARVPSNDIAKLNWQMGERNLVLALCRFADMGDKMEGK